MKFIQRGENLKYPEVILETWRYGEKPVPSWISDNSKVKFIDGEGNITLDIRETTSGGYEIQSAAGDRVFIRVAGKDNYLCWEGKKIISLRPSQFKLLYVAEENKKKHPIHLGLDALKMRITNTILYIYKVLK